MHIAARPAISARSRILHSLTSELRSKLSECAVFDGAPFRPIDVSIILGAGTEYRIAESTTLFGGISYNRGLLNMITKYGAFDENNAFKRSPSNITLANANDRYSIRIDMVSLDLGVKF